jgi:hypothetical protein
MGSLAFAFGGQKDSGDIGIDCVESSFIVNSAFSSSCASVEENLGTIHDIVSFKHFHSHFSVLLRCLDIR